MLANVLLLSFLVVCLVVVSRYIVSTKRGVVKATISCVFGLISLGAVNLLSSLTSFTLSVNIFTCFVALVLSAPGVISLIILKNIFGM